MDNKEVLLQVALDLFHAKGYDAVGIQEIVDKAGVTKPTLTITLEVRRDFCSIF